MEDIAAAAEATMAAADAAEADTEDTDHRVIGTSGHLKTRKPRVIAAFHLSASCVLKLSFHSGDVADIGASFLRLQETAENLSGTSFRQTGYKLKRGWSGDWAELAAHVLD